MKRTPDSLANAAFAKEPSCHANQKHHDNYWLIFHVAKKIHCSIVIRPVALAPPTVIWRILTGITVVLVVTVITVGIVRRQGFHRHSNKKICREESLKGVLKGGETSRLSRKHLQALSFAHILLTLGSYKGMNGAS